MWKIKKSTFVLLMILLSSFSYALINGLFPLTNSFYNQNTTFYNNSNRTYYIDVWQNGYIDIATMTIKGIPQILTNNSISSFDNKTDNFNLAITSNNYYRIGKNENSSYGSALTLPCPVYGAKYYNYTNTELSGALAILIETTQSGNVSLPSGCVKDKLELAQCETPSPFSRPIYCKDNTGSWNSFTSAVNQEFTNIFPLIPYERLYLKVPNSAYVENVTFNITGLKTT